MKAATAILVTVVGAECGLVAKLSQEPVRQERPTTFAARLFHSNEP